MSPSEIRVTQSRQRLEIDWPDGTSSRLAAAHLRAHCRSSSAVRAALDGDDGASGDLRIADVRLVGTYAINLVFSDGHDRGIYPWRYLRALGGLGDGDEDGADRRGLDE